MSGWRCCRKTQLGEGGMASLSADSRSRYADIALRSELFVQIVHLIGDGRRWKGMGGYCRSGGDVARSGR
jgi:hypothetical protein